MSKIKQLFGDKEFNRKLLSLTFPIAVQNLMLASVAAADTIMLGSFDQNLMAAVSLASKAQFLQNMILCSVVSVLIILGAQYWGKKDPKSLNEIFFISLRINLIISVLFFLACEFIPETIMSLLTNVPDLIDIGAGYLRIAGWSYLLTGISQTFIGILKVTEKAKAAAIISVVTVGLNIVLNAILIFGLLGFPQMGVAGAAIATLCARIVEVIWSVLLIFRKGYYRPHFSGMVRLNISLFKDFIKHFAPLAGAFLLWSMGITVYASCLGHLGEDATAADSIANVVCELVCCLCNGIASGGGILIGNELGSGKLELGKLYGERIKIFSVICGILSMVIVWAVIPPLMAFVKLTPQARTYLLQIMLIMSVYMIGRAMNTILINGILDSGGDTKFDPLSLTVCMWMVGVPLSLLGTFVFGWPVAVVYALTRLDEVAKIPWTLFHYKKYLWVKDLTRERG